MGIDLNKSRINGIIVNGVGKEVTIPLVITDESLKKTLINKDITPIEFAKYKTFNNKRKSILRLEKINNFKFTKVTNVFYLNEYLNILKEKNIELPSEETELNTDIIKEKIAYLLGSDKKDMNLDEIKQYRKTLDTENAKDTKNKTENITKKSKPKKEDLVFDIKELQKQHLERKLGNDK